MRASTIWFVSPFPVSRPSEYSNGPAFAPYNTATSEYLCSKSIKAVVAGQPCGHCG